jgi:hypothetical protein
LLQQLRKRFAKTVPIAPGQILKLYVAHRNRDGAAGFRHAVEVVIKAVSPREQNLALFVGGRR